MAKAILQPMARLQGVAYNIDTMARFKYEEHRKQKGSITKSTWKGQDKKSMENIVDALETKSQELESLKADKPSRN